MGRRNTAQQIYHALGIDVFIVSHEYARQNPSYTKKGPGRKHQQGKIKSKE